MLHCIILYSGMAKSWQVLLLLYVLLSGRVNEHSVVRTILLLHVLYYLYHFIIHVVACMHSNLIVTYSDCYHIFSFCQMLIVEAFQNLKSHHLTWDLREFQLISEYVPIDIVCLHLNKDLYCFS